MRKIVHFAIPGLMALLMGSLLLIKGFEENDQSGPLSFEGTWSVSGEEEGFAWYLRYTFNNGTYTMEGYPPTEATGTYTATELEPNHYTLTLLADPTEYNSDPTSETWDVWLNDDGQSLEVTNGYTYTLEQN